MDMHQKNVPLKIGLHILQNRNHEERESKIGSVFMKNKEKFFIVFCIFFFAFSNVAFAHGGRTDSSGGHHDYNNVSGLGSYHYHCDGHPAHLHENGICPYSSSNNSDTPYTVEPLPDLPSSKSEYDSNESKKDIDSTQSTNDFNRTSLGKISELKVSLAFIVIYLIALLYRIRVQRELYIFPFVISLICLCGMFICTVFENIGCIAVLGICAVINLFSDR